MANCFPITKYIYLFVLFLISFILITISSSLELLGLGLLFASNTIYSILLVSDVLHFMEKTSRQTYINGLTTWSIIIGAVFTILSSIFMIIMLYSLKTEFYKKGTPIQLKGEEREQMNLFENLWIISIVLMSVISLNIYFNADRLSYSISVLLDNIVNLKDTSKKYIIIFILTLLIFGTGGSLSLIFIDKYYHDSKLEGLKYNYAMLVFVLSALMLLNFIRVGIFLVGQDHLEWLVQNAFGIDAVFDILKWASIVISLVFSGLSINSFVKIPDVYNVYNDLYTRFVLFITFTLILLFSLLANSTHFVDLIVLLVRAFAPLVLLGITSYMVYIGNNFLRISKSKLSG